MKKGTLFCIIAAVGFGILPTIQNELILHGIPRVSCILYSNACMLAGGLAACRQKGLRAALPAGKALWLGVIGLMGMGLTPLLLTGAFAYIPVGTAIVIHFLYPAGEGDTGHAGNGEGDGRQSRRPHPVAEQHRRTHRYHRGV